VDTYVRDKLFLTMLDMIRGIWRRWRKRRANRCGRPRGDPGPRARERRRRGSRGATALEKRSLQLRVDLALFLSLARQYLEGPQKFRFLGSQFAASLLASDVRAIWNPAGGFETATGARGFYRFLSVSPSALNHALFTQTDRYLAPETESRPVTWTGADARRADEPPGGRLAGPHGDRHGAPAVPGAPVHERHSGHLFRACAKAASTQEPAYTLQADALLAQSRPSGSGRTAQTGRGDLEHGIDLGTALMHMEEYEQAVASSTRDREMRDPSRLLNAWNHRGICLLRLKRLTEATNSFNEACGIMPTQGGMVHKASA